MTDEPAAIQAAFADFRLIKGRKVCQLVMEIPIEGADAALAALGGIPQPQSDRWVAVVRLNSASAINESLPPDETFEIMQDPQPKKSITYGELTEGTVLVEGEDSYQYQNGDWVPNNPNQKGLYPTHAKPESEPKEKRKWDDLKLSIQAGIRCEEKAFWRYCEECGYLDVMSAESAANVVRELCNIDSRSGLNDNSEAAARWRDLDRSYQAWLKAGE